MKTDKEELKKYIDECITEALSGKVMHKGYTKCTYCGTIIKEGYLCNNPECESNTKQEPKEPQEKVDEGVIEIVGSDDDSKD